MKSRLGHWIAFVLSLVAVMAVAIAIQSYGEIFNRRFDLTEEGRLSLSPYTLSILTEVKHPLKVELYYRRGERQKSRDILELMRDHCPELSFELVDLDRNPARAKDHGVQHYDRAVLFYQGRETTIPAGSEETLSGGIAKLLHEKPRVLYFVSGHRERAVEAGSDDQYGRATQLLRNAGFEVRSLSLLREASVPADASVVILGGPEVDLVESEIDKLDGYLEKGGAVLVLVDPLELPVLTAWLRRRGISLQDDVVIDRTNRVYGSDGTNAVVPFYRQHDVTRAMDIPAVLGRARSVSLANGGDDDEVLHASIVARTANESFAAAGAGRTKQGEVEFDATRDRAGPVGIMAVAVLGSGDEKGGRLAVIGDADFPTDSFLALLGNKDLLVSTIGWLTTDPVVGAQPPEQSTRLGPVSPVYVSDSWARVILFTTVVAEPALFLVVGLAVVLIRRRRQ